VIKTKLREILKDVDLKSCGYGQYWFDVNLDDTNLCKPCCPIAHAVAKTWRPEKDSIRGRTVHNYANTLKVPYKEVRRFVSSYDLGRRAGLLGPEAAEKALHDVEVMLNPKLFEGYKGSKEASDEEPSS
jgi:hypothetical protein